MEERSSCFTFILRSLRVKRTRFLSQHIRCTKCQGIYEVARSRHMALPSPRNFSFFFSFFQDRSQDSQPNLWIKREREGETNDDISRCDAITKGDFSENEQIAALQEGVTWISHKSRNMLRVWKWRGSTSPIPRISPAEMTVNPTAKFARRGSKGD